MMDGMDFDHSFSEGVNEWIDHGTVRWMSDLQVRSKVSDTVPDKCHWIHGSLVQAEANVSISVPTLPRCLEFRGEVAPSSQAQTNPEQGAGR